MQLSNKAKIALILGILLILAIGLVFWFNQKNQQSSTLPDQTPISSEDIFAPSTTAGDGDDILEPDLEPSITNSDQINYISPTSSATKITARTPVPADANGVRKYHVNITPVPGAGYFDYSKNMTGYDVVDYSQSKFAKQSACQVLGLSESWSNIVEKMSCDALNFMAGTVTDALNEINCAFSASAIKANYSPNVTYKLEGGLCLIIDRNK